MLTIGVVESNIGVAVEEHLIRDTTIPVHHGPQRQGDVIIIPAGSSQAEAGDQLTAAGVAVVVGENGGNTHAIHSYEGTSTYRPSRTDGQTLGHLTVNPGSVVIMSHPEHGFMAIGSGSYEIRRQREQANMIRMVED